MKLKHLSKREHQTLVLVGLVICTLVSIYEIGSPTQTYIIQLLVNAVWLLEPEV